MFTPTYLVGAFCASFVESFGVVSGIVFAVFVWFPVILMQCRRLWGVLRS